jgi:hypothetical protein
LHISPKLLAELEKLSNNFRKESIKKLGDLKQEDICGMAEV